LPDQVEIGSMVEVPSLLYQLDELLERVDFLSVGSNDLVQFLYAIDRGNPRVSGRFDALSAPVLRALKDIADKAHAHGKPATVCGELASQPLGDRYRSPPPQSDRSRRCCSTSIAAKPPRSFAR
jgi:phosphotransferase system enzyme I (PtsP)